MPLTPPRLAKKSRSEEHTSELQSRVDLVCRLLLEKKKYDRVLREHFRRGRARPPARSRRVGGACADDDRPRDGNDRERMAILDEPCTQAGWKLTRRDIVYVEDVDQTVERAIAGGAKILIPAQNQFWGDRIAWIM